MTLVHMIFDREVNQERRKKITAKKVNIRKTITLGILKKLTTIKKNKIEFLVEVESIRLKEEGEIKAGMAEVLMIEIEEEIFEMKG
mmetsp:Transcript_17794/g.23480  ORF Transcript_17794/g.23480 Transcript_17794/m.23480 type:complete len:86 (+) Transcript_17794:370-627(+)